MKKHENDEVRDAVRKNYGAVAQAGSRGVEDMAGTIIEKTAAESEGYDLYQIHKLYLIRLNSILHSCLSGRSI